MWRTTSLVVCLLGGILLAAGCQARAKQPEDIAPPAKTGLIRGLGEALDSAVPEESRAELRGQLRTADEILHQAKLQNAAALREANRQQRLPGEEMPNLILLLAAGQSRGPSQKSEPARPAPNLQRLADEGTRFSGFRCTSGDAGARWSLLTGLDAPREAAGSASDTALAVIRPEDLTCAEVLWNGGYTTALVGDCSLDGTIADGNARAHGFDEAIGFRSASEAREAYPEQLWSNGARLGIPDNAGGKRGHRGTDLLLQETLAYLDGHPRGRPFFLCVAWPAGAEPDGVHPLDRVAGALADRLSKLRVQDRSVLFVLSSGGGPAPLLAWGPGRVARGGVRKDPCGPCDLLPTLADFSGVSPSRQPRVSDGKSLARLEKR